jgi:hypothetical protein
MNGFFFSLSCLLCLGQTANAAIVKDVIIQRGDSAITIDVGDEKNPARAKMLQKWITQAADATRAVSGRFPLKAARVRVIQTDKGWGDSPVPFGQTQRGKNVEVLLYVRRDASADALQNDWTAVHELSHLYHPYLGKKGRWMAEGLASYFQNVLRARAGMLDEESAWKKLDAGFARGEDSEQGTRLDALTLRNGTMRIYWAGAAFWLEADLALRREHRTGLDAVLDEYARCCLVGTATVAPDDFATALDQIVGAPLFVPLQERYAASTEFPSLVETYAELGIRRDGNKLVFAGDVDHQGIRKAVMNSATRR